MHSVPGICPICGEKLNVHRLRCHDCGSAIEGDFEMDSFTYLSKEQKQFAEVFIKCRGNIKEVGKELGISYPTVKGRLDDVVEALGYGDFYGFYEPEAEQNMKKQVLEKLNRGEISTEDAIKLLKED